MKKQYVTILVTALVVYALHDKIATLPLVNKIPTV